MLFTSRLLTELERRYRQCEKKALAVVWACEKAHIYLIGHNFLIAVNNRTVQLIYGNAKSNTPAMIERWPLRITQFDFTIVQRPGSQTSQNTTQEVREASEVVQSATPSAMTLREISEATSNDKELCEFRKCLVILSGHRIVMSVTLQVRVVEFAHVGHQVIVITKSLLRSRVWFRKMDEMLEKLVKMCRECQADTNRKIYEPIRPSKLPDRQ